jgi:regulator of sigma E protease
MISLLIFLFILGLLIIVHEFGHFITARKMGVKIEKFSLGFGPQIFTRKRGDTEYTVSAVPLGGYVKLAGDSLEEYHGKSYEYLAQPVGKRFWIIFFGPLLNYVLGFLFLWLIFFTGYPTLTAKVGGVLDGFGAKAAGVKAADRIISIDGQKIQYWEELQAIVHSRAETDTVRLAVLRDGQELAINVNIKKKSIDDTLGQKHSVGLLGITASDEIITVRHGLLKSLTLAVDKTWWLTRITYQALWRIVTGKLSMRESVTGPLGIFFITSKAASIGLTAVIHLIAVLSISLGIFNLLPLPVLDGGHLALLGLEKIRGKYISLKAEQAINRAGFTLIITLAIIVTCNDLFKFFGDKIGRMLSK